MYSVRDEQFEGPLDLLLSLIEKEKLDITQISLAKITGAYLEHTNKLDGNSAEIADFLVIAAKLLYIKSKELIPQITNDKEEDEIADLEEKLREYQIYKKAAKQFDIKLSSLDRSYRKRGKSQIVATFTPPESINKINLFAIFQEVINKAGKELPVQAEIKSEKKVTLKEKRADILFQLKKDKKISFRSFLSKSHNKPEIIVTFLAILEMIKQQEISVQQDENFADFIIMGVE